MSLASRTEAFDRLRARFECTRPAAQLPRLLRSGGSLCTVATGPDARVRPKGEIILAFLRTVNQLLTTFLAISAAISLASRAGGPALPDHGRRRDNISVARTV